MSRHSRRIIGRGRVNFGRTLRFRFDGAEYVGHEGDTLASALLANGVWLAGRSFKYHRRRGFYAAGAEETNALVEVRGMDGLRAPNRPASELRLYDGMEAFSQNCSPSLRYDIGALRGSLFAPFLGAGFYYKTFMGPTRKGWRFYEHMIRRAAGMGRLSEDVMDHAQHESANLFTDVLVIGSGPAGLAAAGAAAASGARVTLVERDFAAGGSLLGERGGSQADIWRRRILSFLEESENVRIFLRTECFGAYDGNCFGMVERLREAGESGAGSRSRLWRVRARRVILASGALERPLVCEGNDLPGVVLSSAARLWLTRWGVLPERRIVIAANNDSAWETAEELAFAGMEVGAKITLLDARREGAGSERLQRLRMRGVEIHLGYVPIAVRGGRRVKGLLAAPFDADANIVVPDNDGDGDDGAGSNGGGDSAGEGRTDEGTTNEGAVKESAEAMETDNGVGDTAGKVAGKTRYFAADMVCLSGGLDPNLRLWSQRGLSPRYDEKIAAFVPSDEMPPGWEVVGGARGTFSRGEAIKEGRRAAEAAVGSRAASFGADDDNGGALADIFTIDDGDELARGGWRVAPCPLWLSRGGEDVFSRRAFVDLSGDVTVKDMAIAVREGYNQPEHAKRYTTAGMGADQGKTSGTNAAGILSLFAKRKMERLGTARPPYTPVEIASLAGAEVGRHFRPVRRSPLHDVHLREGVQWIESGEWMRARYYPASPQESVEAGYVRESAAVRGGVGMTDVSTLGKILVQGADAEKFLERVYVNNIASLKPGRVRYGVMLRDDGMVFDDGTLTRTKDGGFWITTTTANAGAVLQRLEFLHQAEWRDLEVFLTSVSDSWAGIAVAGRESLSVVSSVFADDDIASLPHMGALEVLYGGESARVHRMSFSGERAYEVFVAAHFGVSLWERLREAGSERGLVPYGLEALDALRVEKGHITVSEIDGRVTLADLRFEGMLRRKSGLAVGVPLGRRAGLTDGDRPCLTGLRPLGAGQRIESGSVLFGMEGEMSGHGEGWVSSACYSGECGGYIALGFLSRARAREGEEVRCFNPVGRSVVVARVVSPCFVDSEGERMR
ncbi:MAG: 2Fe-2S iron-sulfur cluster-binding protein [Alphaproteobacteria bacterium]|nr:2Fe-2S iron-sulfur cluster-binding protein [Alphaproteobacteria bacterium]MDA7988669.1 2Fe-2S iron-sulfur cluster-binding protein [Alphaproteobacteria bacterium]MDA8008522.1 2Fe-2S iron-sulfur cluster-binding protein [Alphaproteobacteria bacterium]